MKPSCLNCNHYLKLQDRCKHWLSSGHMKLKEELGLEFTTECPAHEFHPREQRHQDLQKIVGAMK